MSTEKLPVQCWIIFLKLSGWDGVDVFLQPARIPLVLWHWHQSHHGAHFHWQSCPPDQSSLCEVSGAGFFISLAMVNMTAHCWLDGCPGLDSLQSYRWYQISFQPGRGSADCVDVLLRSTGCMYCRGLGPTQTRYWLSNTRYSTESLLLPPTNTSGGVSVTLFSIIYTFITSNL